MRYTEDTVLAERVEAADAAGKNIPSMSMLDLVLNSLQDDKAEDIVTIELQGKSQIADYMVVASGRSTRQVSAIAEKLSDRLKQNMGVIARIEGKAAGDWVLLDTGDIIVHVFRPEVREFYQLEKMWLSTPNAEDT
ncbi:MAG: ribosome silencing factor [Amylibacter sp.]